MNSNKDSSIKILDCTLRDGGYINDWNFGAETIDSIVKRIDAARVDIIELGFLKNCIYEKGRTLYNSIAELRQSVPLEKIKAQIVLMALHNTYDVKNLEKNDGTIFAIRVTFHDYDIDEGLTFCQEVMKKGYRVFVNPINLMGYSDIKIVKLLYKINEIHPYAFSIVDTFGSMKKTDLVRILSLCENNLEKDIVLGIHLHENMAMSFSLAQIFMDVKSPLRKCVIDASLNGMGRVPGNLCIELIMDYLNSGYGTDYLMSPILDAIDEFIIPIKKENPWGYEADYFLSAKYNLHRNYAEYLQKTGRLTSRDIDNILGQISEDKKNKYDEDYIEDLYSMYQNRDVYDAAVVDSLKKEFKGEDVLLVAPGKSIDAFADMLSEKLKENKRKVITVNFFHKHVNNQYAFFSNGKRYEQYLEYCRDNKIIISSNIVSAKGDIKVINYNRLVYDTRGDKCDNCGVMLLRLLKELEVRKVFLAGFDGVTDEKCYSADYFSAFPLGKKEDNKKIAHEIYKLSKDLRIEFLTTSIYQKYKDED